MHVGRYEGDFTVKKDVDATEDDIRRSSLILIGRPASNAVTAKIQPALPIRLEGDELVARRRHPAKGLRVTLVHPNPLSQSRYVLVHYATDVKDLAVLGNDEADCAIFTKCKEGKTRFVEVGHFDGRWRFGQE